MVLRIISGAALICASLPSPASGQAVSPAVAVAPVCAKLAADYDQVEKALAMTFAQGSSDNSPVNETNRQLVASNYLAQANITIAIMQANHCPLPDHAPSVQRYFSAALACAADRQKSEAPESCKMENWKPAQ